MGKIIKIAIKVLGWSLASILALVLAIFILLQDKGIQNRLVKHVSTTLSNRLNTNVYIESFRFTLPFHVKLHNLGIDDQRGNPLVHVGSLRASLRGFAYGFSYLKLRNVDVDQLKVNMIRYQGDTVMNFQFIADQFAAKDTAAAQPSAFKAELNNISLSDSEFLFRDYNADSTDFGIDFNHLQISGINLNASRISFINDTLSARIQTLSAMERSGLKIKRFSSKVMLTPGSIIAESAILQTAASDLLFDLGFYFNNFSAFSHFTDSVYIQADIFPSELNTLDIAWFAPELKGMNNLLHFEGNVRGEISSFRGNNLDIRFANSTRLRGDVAMDGLPDFHNTFIYFDIAELFTTATDMQRFRLPGDIPVFLAAPTHIIQLGRMTMAGQFSGFASDFVVYSDISTSIGRISTDISLKFHNDELVYSGKLSTVGFQIGKLLNQEELLGVANLTAEVKGRGQSISDLDLSFDLAASSFDFLGNNYQMMNASGSLNDKKFDGTLQLTDELINLNFKGLFDLNLEPPVFDFTADISNAHLAKMNLIERDTSVVLSTSLKFDFTGNHPDNLQGDILVTNTTYSEKGEAFSIDRIEFNAFAHDLNNKSFRLRSDIADADISGAFCYNHLMASLEHLLDRNTTRPELHKIPDEAIQPQKFTASLTLKNTQPLSQLFMPSLILLDGAVIKSSYNSLESKLTLNGTASVVSVAGIEIREWYFNLDACNRLMVTNSGAGKVLLSEQQPGDPMAISVEQLLLQTQLQGDTMHYRLTWDDQKEINPLRGMVAGFFAFNRPPLVEFRITESAMRFHQTDWAFNNDNYILFDSLATHVNQVALLGGNQKIMLNGVISDSPLDRLDVRFDKFMMRNLNFFLEPAGITLDGVMGGMVEITEAISNPSFEAALIVNNLVLNGETLGDLEITTSYDPLERSVWIDSRIIYTGNVGTITPVSIRGFYYPYETEQQIDLDLVLQNFRLGAINPFLKGLVSDMRGLASGNIELSGKIYEPQLQGSIALMRTEFRVDYTNIIYSLADEFTIEKDRIHASNVKVYDEFGGHGICNIDIRHNNFSDFLLDIQVQANNLAGLNTDASHNTLFFGSAFATGSFAITGPLDDLVMSIHARSEPNTNITIPISFAVDVADNNFIHYVNPYDTLQAVEAVAEQPSSMAVNMEFDITNDATVQIYLPYQMGNIHSNGTGNMKMSYANGDFTMYGDFRVNQGTFLFSLQNMINREFLLESGGYIQFSGSPYDATINMQAVYRIRATLNSLPNIAEEYRNRRFPVECILILENSLMNPDISFTVRMPDVDEEVRRQVFSAIDTTNSVIMSRQMISLLVLNMFNFTPDQGTIVSSLSASGFDMLSNQLNNWLSQISQDFDIGVNYRPGDQLSPEEVELALSTQLFNERVVIDGNFAMGANQAAQNTSNVIGDVNVEVKLTRDGRLRIKAFNKYNNMDIARRPAPYTQGIGLFYRREFNNIHDFINSRPKQRIEGEFTVEENPDN